MTHRPATALLLRCLAGQTRLPRPEVERLAGARRRPFNAALGEVGNRRRVPRDLVSSAVVSDRTWSSKSSARSATSSAATKHKNALRRCPLAAGSRLSLRLSRWRRREPCQVWQQRRGLCRQVSVTPMKVDFSIASRTFPARTGPFSTKARPGGDFRSAHAQAEPEVPTSKREPMAAQDLSCREG